MLALRERVASKAAEAAKMNVRLQEMKKELEYYKTIEAVEREARERLGMARPGEKIYYIVVSSEDTK